MTTITAPIAAAAAPVGVATRRRRRVLRTTAWGTLGLGASMLWVFPVYWMLLSALTPNARLRATTPSFLPTHATWSNFASVLTNPQSNFWGALRMSLAVTLTTVVVVLLFAFLASIAISRFSFRGRKAFVLAVLFIQMLPAEGLFIAQYKMLASVGEVAPMFGLETVLGLSVLYVAAIIPFTVWMLRGFVAGVPAELEEAAMVDGLSRTGAFVRITLPLLAPGLVASGVYAFLQAWNEFTVAVVILQKSSQTLPLWLRGFLTASAQRGVDWAEVMAASTLIAVPVIIFFLIVQGRMTSGLVSGAVKG